MVSSRDLLKDKDWKSKLPKMKIQPPPPRYLWQFPGRMRELIEGVTSATGQIIGFRIVPRPVPNLYHSRYVRRPVYPNLPPGLRIDRIYRPRRAPNN